MPVRLAIRFGNDHMVPQRTGVAQGLLGDALVGKANGHLLGDAR